MVKLVSPSVNLTRCRMKILLLVLVLLVPNYAKKLECLRNNRGFDYEGRQNVTVSGLSCQPWSLQFPHQHNFTDPHFFPDASMDDVSNYCRNPDRYWRNVGNTTVSDISYYNLWCFTTDPDVRIDQCDVPFCSDHQECRRTELGYDYRGDVEVSASGRQCDLWASLDHRYCRNFPETPQRQRPWCYTNTTLDEWEYCNIPFCKPAMNCKRTASGEEYSGTISSTWTERSCQRWDTQAPHQHSFTEPELFPDASLEDASNYCRNPSADPAGPWCYTTDPQVRFQYCDVPVCRDCKTSQDGREYSGSLFTSVNGYTCTNWADSLGDLHNFTESDRFPDANVEAAENFCRNPGNPEPLTHVDGPWCYVNNPFIDWEACDIPTCDDQSEDVERPPVARHVLHIGIDGLRPDCMVDAPGGLPNIMGRLAHQGTYTLTNARTVVWSYSAPGWSNQLCSMPPEKTGINSNEWVPNWNGAENVLTGVMGGETRFPCIFQHLKAQDANIRTAAFYDWWWIETMASKGFPGSVDKDRKYALDLYPIWDPVLARDAAAYLEDLIPSADRSYTFIYLGNVDSSGHAWSWCSNQYLRAVSMADRQVGLMLDAIDNLDAGDEVMVILSTDHGGHDFGHGEAIDEDVIIPVILRGPGVKQNFTFNFEVGNQDIPPTVTWALGLRPSNWWSGKNMWEAFETLNS